MVILWVEVWIEPVKIVCPLHGDNDPLDRSQQHKRQNQHGWQRPIDMQNRVNLVAGLNVKNCADDYVAHNSHRNVGWGIVCAVMVQCLRAMRATVVDPQIAFKQRTFATFRAFAANSVFESGPQVALWFGHNSIIDRQILSCSFSSIPYLFLRRPPIPFRCVVLRGRPRLGGVVFSPRDNISKRNEPASGSASISLTDT